MAILVVRNKDFVRSQGLRRHYGQDELLIPFEPRNAAAANDMCQSLMKYVEQSGRRIVAGEKVTWATSMIRFNLEGEFLVAHGLDIKQDIFKRGVDELLDTWKRQREVCQKGGSEYVNTRLEDMIVVSPDLLIDSSKVMEGFRYPPKVPNCGWWLIGESFSGELESMQRVHVGHVVRLHLSVVDYLALAPGFSFRPDTGAVWFNDEASRREPV